MLCHAVDYAFRRLTRDDEPSSVGAYTLCKDNSYDNSKPVMTRWELADLTMIGILCPPIELWFCFCEVTCRLEISDESMIRLGVRWTNLMLI